MSNFAALVQTRISRARNEGRLTRGSLVHEGERADAEAVGAGVLAMRHLSETNQACASDERCTKTWQMLEVAAQGSPADARTALTALQSLLHALTQEDADVAGDQEVQVFRRRLHLLLDH